MESTVNAHFLECCHNANICRWRWRKSLICQNNLFDFTLTFKCSIKSNYLHEMRFGKIQNVRVNNVEIPFTEFVEKNDFSDFRTKTFENIIGEFSEAKFSSDGQSKNAFLGRMNATFALNGQSVEIYSENAQLMNI